MWDCAESAFVLDIGSTSCYSFFNGEVKAGKDKDTNFSAVKTNSPDPQISKTLNPEHPRGLNPTHSTSPNSERSKPETLKALYDLSASPSSDELCKLFHGLWPRRNSTSQWRASRYRLSDRQPQKLSSAPLFCADKRSQVAQSQSTTPASIHLLQDPLRRRTPARACVWLCSGVAQV